MELQFQLPKNSRAASRRSFSRWYGKGREWETPPELFEQLDSEFHFTLDPCATPQNAKCDKFFTERDNGLTKDWGHDRVFMNPPYGREIAAWTKKAVEASHKGATVVGLLPVSTDLAWWHQDVLSAGAEIRYIRGRVKFRMGNRIAIPFHATVIVVWQPK